MKKKKPTLTHYTKRLKKVRLARTITVIATLFVSGVVVAANVLPQVIKSNAAVPDASNDVIAGGVNQYNGAAAKDELIKRVYDANTAEAQSARALYAKFGVTRASIQNSTFGWMYGPNVAGEKVNPNIAIGPYANWRSFGRTNGPGFIPLDVAYGSSTARFYHKPFKDAMPSWSGGTSAMPYLKDTSGTNAASKWFIALTCGNIVVNEIPSNPSINFNKDVVAVTRANKAVDPKVAGFKLQLNDLIRYRLRGTNSNVAYPAGLRLIDQIPTGTELAPNGQGDSNDWNTQVTKVPGATVNGKAAVAWDFGIIPANDSGYTDFVVKVTSVASQICNIGLWGKPGTLPNDTNQVCLQVQQNAPLLTVTKQANNAPAPVKVGDKVTYGIKLTNTGNAAATNAIALDILKRIALDPTKPDVKTLSAKFVSLGAARLTKTSDGSTVAATLTKVDASNQATYANNNKDAFGYVVNTMPAGTELNFTVTTEAAILPQACDFAIGNYPGSGNPIAVTETPDVCIPVVNPKEPQITVVKTSPTANRNVARGQVINYSIVVTNKSTEGAQTTPVTVTDTFSPADAFKDIKETGRSSSFNASITGPTKQANGLTWKIASIPAGGKVTFNISATVGDTVADTTKVCNNATITMTPPNTIVTETSSTICNTVSLIKQSKTAKYVDRTDDPQKSPANAGDKIEYTLTTTNQASTVAKDYIVSEDLVDVLTYANVDVEGSGGATLTGSRLTWPVKDIPAGGSITNKFTVTVKDPVPNNVPSNTNPSDYDYNMFNFYGNEVNIKVNKPIIDRIIEVASNLPETGAAQYGLVIFFLGMSVYFFVRNKQLTSELAAATVEYQHQASPSSLAQAENLIHPEEPDSTTPQPPAAPPAV